MSSSEGLDAGAALAEAEELELRPGIQLSVDLAMSFISNRSRYLSLDVFRGIAVALMIVVNSLGSGATYAPLLHAGWNGFTLADAVFPTFLFVVGTSMSFSMGRYESIGNAAVLKKIIKRAAVIFLLGYLSYWFPFVGVNDAGGWFVRPISETRIPGVLQRIALCYLFASLIVFYFKITGALIFSVLGLLGYHLILGLFGDLTMVGNAGTKLDLRLIGEGHMYHGEGIAFDPEGLLSTLPAIVNVIGGYVTGVYIQRNGRNLQTLTKLFAVGGLLIVAGIGWSFLLPINKKLWTSSYVLLTVGIDLIVLPMLVFLVDMLHLRKWTYFFEVFGKNALLIYLFSEVFVVLLRTFDIGGASWHSWIYRNLFQSWAGDRNGSVLFALWMMLICWAIGYAMDRRKIYIKV